METKKEAPLKIIAVTEVKAIIDQIYGIDLVIENRDLIEFGGPLLRYRSFSSLPMSTPLEFVSFVKEAKPDLYWVWISENSEIGEPVDMFPGLYHHTFKHPGRE